MVSTTTNQVQHTGSQAGEYYQVITMVSTTNQVQQTGSLAGEY